MKEFRFLDWEVYQSSQELLTVCLRITKDLPKEYRYELGSQITRSAFSVVLNIAEGSGKESDKELNRFVEIALGSLYETLAGMDSLRINKFISEEEFDKVRNTIESIARQLGGFKKKLKSVES